MRNFFRIVVLVPLALVIVAFAIANRQVVSFTLDPLGLMPAALNFQMPLFALAFALVIFGVIVGGAATWFRQSHWRRAARELDAEVRRLRSDNDRLRKQAEMAEAAARSRAEPARLIRPPAA
jgi:uncharacterized integral membrane protein